MATSGAAVTKLALLIDGDNVSATYMPLIMREAEMIGVVGVRRIYGQFKSGRMKAWLKQLEAFNLTPVNVSPLTRGKNATDMKLVIEAMDMLNGRGFDGFLIASSDGDFTPLVVRIRANAVACYGFGMKKAPEGYKTEFDRFFECDTIMASEKSAARRTTTRIAKPAAPARVTPEMPKATVPSVSPPVQPSSRRRQTQTPKAPIPVRDVHSAIEAVSESDGWSHLGSVSNELRRRISDFSPSKYGYSTLKRLIAAMPDIEVRTAAGGTTFVRRRPA